MTVGEVFFKSCLISNLRNPWHLASAFHLEISEMNTIITPRKGGWKNSGAEQVEVRVGLRTRSVVLWGHA